MSIFLCRYLAIQQVADVERFAKRAVSMEEDGLWQYNSSQPHSTQQNIQQEHPASEDKKRHRPRTKLT